MQASSTELVFFFFIKKKNSNVLIIIAQPIASDFFFFTHNSLIDCFRTEKLLWKAMRTQASCWRPHLHIGLCVCLWDTRCVRHTRLDGSFESPCWQSLSIEQCIYTPTNTHTHVHTHTLCEEECTSCVTGVLLLLRPKLLVAKSDSILYVLKRWCVIRLFCIPRIS